MELNTFTDLHCPKCDGKSFSRIIKLSSRQGSGTVETLQGYLCIGCQVEMDLHQMQSGMAVRALKAEIARKEAEVAALLGEPAHAGEV